MKKVITYGTFDLLHYGHINLLQRAKALGDYLIVALSTQKTVRSDPVCGFSHSGAELGTKDFGCQRI